MSFKDHRILIDDWFAALNDNDFDRWVAMHSADVVWSFPESGFALHGHDALRAAIESFVTEQPDVRFEEVQAFGQDDRACIEWTEAGTRADSGEPVEYHFCGTLRFETGKIAEVHRFGGRRKSS